MLFEGNIRELAIAGRDFRRVIATGPHSQLVTMSLPPREDIGMEVHPETDQILFIASGKGKALVDGTSADVREGDAVLVPAGAEHNLTNVGTGNLALFAVCTPPHHEPGTVHRSKAEAMAAEHATEHVRR